ncbi:unnamed protein product [Orchesella dallaii]|uniref:Flavin-containing monooxygenase n=1 Tax=Orchesella dallaii TaxID=48710 RepID=A0ABP1S3T1_9HEXA
MAASKSTRHETILIEDDFKICIIGAGMSGMCAAIQLKKQFNHLDNVTIFEGLEDIGGTWLINTYPGCACDIPGHLYSYSFERNPDWSKSFVDQEEILEYLRNVAKKHSLYEKIKFRYRVTELRWDDLNSEWIVKVLNERNSEELTYKFNIVITGIGALRAPQIPPQFEAFQGPKIHTAEWNHSIDLQDKIVAVIGTGASSVQLVPAIAPKVKQLILYQRHAAWIFPRLQVSYSRFARFTFRWIPGVMSSVRNFLYCYFEAGHSAFKMNTMMRKAVISVANLHRKRQVKCPLLRDKLKPNYEFGCKRILMSNEYYPAVSRENVKVVVDGIKSVGQDTIVHNDGTSTQPDVIVFATGFKITEYFSPLKIFGKEGLDLFAKWKKNSPTAYLGVNTSDAPNLFFIIGPHSGNGHNSLIFMIECQVSWITKVIKEFQRKKLKSVVVKKSAEEDYMRFIDEEMKTMVWTNSECGSWYINENGKAFAIWPKSLTSYWNLSRRLNFAHLEFL